jgi:hypothetical protein
MAIFLEIKVYAVEIASTLVFVAFIARETMKAIQHLFNAKGNENTVCILVLPPSLASVAELSTTHPHLGKSVPRSPSLNRSARHTSYKPANPPANASAASRTHGTPPP